MAIDTDTIKNFVYDPASMQKYILDELDTASKGKYSVVDITNPFVVAVETAVTCAASAIQETSNQIRKQYPSLASLEDDLFHHVSDNESSYMFATPAEVKIRFIVNVIDIKNYGVSAEDGSYKEIIIPSGTTITALDTPMTLLNDILVRLYSNNDVFVEQQLDSSNDLAYSDVSILDGYLVTDAGNTTWIYFDTMVKQVKKTTITQAIALSSGFSKLVPLTDSFCHANIYYKNNSTNGYVSIPKMFNDEYIDPFTASCVVKLYDKNVFFKIPEQYILEGLISGNIKIDLYETKGKQYLPLNKYQVSDFSYVLGDTGKSSQAAALTNIAFQCMATSVLVGGTDAMSLTNLRNAIINNTTGDIDLPITEKQIEQYGSNNGYTIIKNTDIVTEREFLGLKALPEISNNLILAHHTVFFNTAEVVVDEIKDYENIIVTDSRFIIKSNTVFKNNNGIFKILSNLELEELRNLNSISLAEYLKKNKLFYNPFYYVIEKSEDYINSRVYDLDNPSINHTMIKEKNTTLQQRANINKYTIKKTTNGYGLYVSLTTNEAFDKLEQKSIILQLKIPLYGGTSYAYINSTYDANKKYYYFNIDTNLSISEDNTIDLQNGISNLFTKEFSLTTDVELFICTTDVNVIDPTNFLKPDININSYNVVVFTKEAINITFGTELKYIYNNLYSIYSERKYATYTEDVPMVYEEDVYEVDPETGTIISIVKEDGEFKTKYTILHKAGDPVLDTNGNQIYKYRKGETMLDASGNPIVNLDTGLVRYIDILMLEYEFLASTSNAYYNYNKLTIDNLKHYILNELEQINSKLLEKTTIKFKSFNTTNNLSVTNNNTTVYIKNNCSPKVLLYIQNTSFLDSTTKENYKTIIGTIFNSYFSNSKIVLEEIKNEIKNKIGSIVAGVKVSNIDSTNSEIINIKDKTNRFYLNKIIDTNKNNELVVKYDLDLEFIYI